MFDEFVPETPAWLKPILSEAAARYGIPSLLMSAQLSNESIGFSPDVIYGRLDSPAGARGVAQFIIPTALKYGLRIDNQIDERLNPAKAIDAMARYMRDLITTYGTVEKALSAYNSGNPERYKNPNFRTSYGSVGETYKYVRNITGRSGIKGRLALRPPRQEEKGFMPRLSISFPPPQETARSAIRKLQSVRVPKVIPKAYAETQTRQPQPVPTPTIASFSTASTARYSPQLVPTPTMTRFYVQPPLSLTRQPTITESSAQMLSPKMMSVATPATISARGPMTPNINYTPAFQTPAYATPVARTHTVRPGETLWGIAQRTLGSGTRWRELGYGGDPRQLPIGTVLRY